MVWALLSILLAAEAAPVVRSATGLPVCNAADEALQSDGTDFACGTLAGQGGAPTDAKYIVQQAHADLSAEQAMGTLGTGIVINTTTTGVQSIYGGSACAANTVARSTNASGALTCTAVVAADISGAVATADALSANPAACAANNWVTDIAANGTLTCARPDFSNLSGTATDSQVPLAATATALAANPAACGAGQFVNDIAADGTLSCATPAGGSGVDCIYIPLWSWVAQVGNTTTTTSCTATTNLTAVANRGHQIFVDMDVYTHAKLRYFGNVTGSQTGTVTVALRDIGAGSDSISTTFNSGTTCVDRSSATTDLTAKTGLVQFTARIGDSTTSDDPALSTVSVQFCNGAF